MRLSRLPLPRGRPDRSPCGSAPPQIFLPRQDIDRSPPAARTAMAGAAAPMTMLGTARCGHSGPPRLTTSVGRQRPRKPRPPVRRTTPIWSQPDSFAFVIAPGATETLSNSIIRSRLRRARHNRTPWHRLCPYEERAMTRNNRKMEPLVGRKPSDQRLNHQQAAGGSIRGNQWMQTHSVARDRSFTRFPCGMSVVPARWVRSAERTRARWTVTRRRRLECHQLSRLCDGNDHAKSLSNERSSSGSEPKARASRPPEAERE